MFRGLPPVLFVLSACTSTEVILGGFDTSCGTEDDCSAVFLGNACGCGCGYGSIRAIDTESWFEYEAGKRTGCMDRVECVASPEAIVTCEDSVYHATNSES